MVQERLTQAHALPNVSKPPVMMQPLSSVSRVLQVGLTSKKHSLIDLSVLARWNIKPRLLGVKGVANISIWGQRKRQLQVLINPNKLNEQGVTLDQIINTTGNSLWFSPLSYLNASTPGSGGFIDTPNQRLGVQHVLPISTPEDLAKVVIEGTDITLGQVTDIVENHQLLIGDAIVNGGEGLMLLVEKFPWANTAKVNKNVELALNDLKLGLPDVEIDTSVFKPSNYVEQASANLKLIFLLGLLTMAVGLFIWFRNWQLTLIMTITAFVSLTLSIVAIPFLGLGWNIVSIFGVLAAVGAVISDAINSGKWHVNNYAQKAASIATNPPKPSRNTRYITLFSLLGILIILLPISFLEGASGNIVQTLVISFALTAVISFLISIILMPALTSTILGVAPLNTADKTSYISADNKAVKVTKLQKGARIPIYIITLGIALFALIGFSSLQHQFSPTLKERDILVRWTADAGTSRHEMYRLTSNAVEKIKALAAVAKVGANIGRAVVSDIVKNVNSAEMWISLNESSDYQTALNSIDNAIAQIDGMKAERLSYSKQQISTFEAATDQAITVRLYGYKQSTLESLAVNITQRLNKIDGISNPTIVKNVEEPVIQIKVDLEKARNFKLKPGDIRRASAVFLSGIEVGSLYEDQKVFDVIVWGAPDIRQSLDDVKQLLIEASDKQLVKLSSVADVYIAPMPTIINREAASRYIDIKILVDDTNPVEITELIRESLKGVNYPLEYHTEILTEFADSYNLQQQLLYVFVLTFLGLFLILHAAMGSWKLAAGILVMYVASLSGGILAITILGSLTLAAMTGLFASAGFVIPYLMSSINNYQNIEREHYKSNAVINPKAIGKNLISFAAPVFISVMFFIPVLFLADGPGVSFIIDMTWVILASAISTIFVGSLALPLIYNDVGIGAAHAQDHLFSDQQDTLEGEYNAS